MDTNKFNGTNYKLRNLRIVLDFKNQGYVLDKPLPTALPEGSSPEERLTFDKWLEDNRKVRSIILASMTNEIQKQYDRLDDVPSIMLCMKEVYSVPSQHIRFAVTKASGPRWPKVSSSIYDPFIVNYNMNGLEKSIHELINMLVQYEATTHKSAPTVLVEEALTSKAKGKRAERWKRKKGKGKAVAATASAGAASAAPTGKEKAKVVERSRKLSKDEMILRLGDGKAVAAEAVGFLSLVSNLIMTAQHKRKVDNHENAQLWHARLGHISKDRIRRKDDQKPFVGQSVIANNLLDLVHIDVCGPLNTPARGGFSYFITFTDDYSLYGYVYLMRYKSEAFGRFKEYRLEVENQTGRKIKALRSDRGGEYLSGEFIDYLKENGILSQWTPPGTLQLNGVAERKNRTLLDMVRSMMSFTELPPSFWGYALETAAKLLNIAPSKTVPQTPYEIWHGKPASYKNLFIGYSKETVEYYFYDPFEEKVFISRNAVFLEKGFPSDSRGDEVFLEESSEEPRHDSTTSFEPPVLTDSVPVLRRSTRESRVPESYGFVGLTSQLDNDL
ncbi:UNVERIFIED_CONTAM: Retrovirus-related Pol polyprotein from transposon TNT 1-94 [Sesamum latifolium]|uniref:Retrovirus-related Pol polyprotein from transposon TNT 1-94 n=1 Tax=Sesamum latifolium TaxID=2727402 RepID=A0AAW2TDS2_9LAMI